MVHVFGGRRGGEGGEGEVPHRSGSNRHNELELAGGHVSATQHVKRTHQTTHKNAVHFVLESGRRAAKWRAVPGYGATVSVAAWLLVAVATATRAHKNAQHFAFANGQEDEEWHVFPGARQPNVLSMALF